MLTTLFCLVLGIAAPKEIVIIGYRDGEPFEIQVQKLPVLDLEGSPAYLEIVAADDLIDMMEHAARDGVFISVNYAFRDHEQQKRVQKRTPQFAAIPGYSPHESGIAIDINRVVTDRNLSLWLKRNAPKHNFHRPYKHEPWHFEHGYLLR